ncbi:MAG TPA: hypothetical protein VN224_10060 [Xanthomonadales bacterium]|nr:hypothetical protein [Xanthomonadales bacterium]
MNRFDDDDLDRAIAALPLAEPPAGFHARVMAATVYRPEPAVRNWEVWVIGTLVAVAAWLSWMAAATPHATERIAGALLNVAVQTAAFTTTYTVLWLAVGVSAAWWISLLTVPASRNRIEAR